MKTAFRDLSDECSGPDFTKTTLADCRCRLDFHPLLYLHQFSALTQAVPSTPIQLLNVCWVPAHCSPCASLCCINLNKPCGRNLQTASLCRSARPSPPQPAAPNNQRATGMFRQRAPTQSHLFTGRGRFKVKLRKVRQSQSYFIYLKPLLV